MCIYCQCNSKNYRKIYEEHYGFIPLDENGKTFHIHHIDGNHVNNNPSNLEALSEKEHYQIHFEQKDWAACKMLGKGIGVSAHILSEFNKKARLQEIENGQHIFLDKDFQNKMKIISQKRVKDKTHHLLSGDIQSKHQNQLLQNKTHNFIGLNSKRLKENTHNFTILYECSVCLKSGKGPNFKRNHFDNCKFKTCVSS